MALEFEKLTVAIEEMVRLTHRRERQRTELLDAALKKLQDNATAWDKLDDCLNRAIQKVDIKKFRAARLLEREEPLDSAIDPPPLPDTATIIACDGSQIQPDRHAAYLYALINIGSIVYFHDRDEPPIQFTLAELDYPGKDAGGTGSELGSRFADNSALVGIYRDKAEIEALARTSWEYQHESRPLLALLDQRLLYWPAIGLGEESGIKEMILHAWQDAMTAMRHNAVSLAGYIVRPGKQSVLTVLETLDIHEPNFDFNRLTRRDRDFGLTDAQLFSRILAPGQRSKVFVDVSQHNDDFRERDEMNEVCFFYLNPSRAGRLIARVDIPRWVAEDPAEVGQIHALIVDQCRILGDYPYVLARADEIAVVGRRDQENLDLMIDNAMQRYGLSSMPTAKRSSKDIARAGRTRHGL